VPLTTVVSSCEFVAGEAIVEYGPPGVVPRLTLYDVAPATAPHVSATLPLLTAPTRFAGAAIGLSTV
jgi:hypothetical protein